jgi:hypothetical protein
MAEMLPQPLADNSNTAMATAMRQQQRQRQWQGRVMAEMGSTTLLMKAETAEARAMEAVMAAVRAAALVMTAMRAMTAASKGNSSKVCCIEGNNVDNSGSGGMCEYADEFGLIKYELEVIIATN